MYVGMYICVNEFKYDCLFACMNEIPTRIDSCTVWRGGGQTVDKLWNNQFFCLGGG